MESQNFIMGVLLVSLVLTGIYFGIKLYQAKQNDGKITIEELIDISTGVGDEIMQILKTGLDIKKEQNLSRKDFLDKFVENKLDRLVDETHLTEKDKEIIKNINVTELVDTFLIQEKKINKK